jgi:hypothetical protein
VATFLNYDGSLLIKQNVVKGKAPVYAGATPTKASDTHYNYTWTGWDKTLAPINENTTYTATFQQDQFAFDVRFVDHDGTVLKTLLVNKGSTVFQTTNDIPTPPHTIYAEGETGIYIYMGWKMADLSAAITADTTITAPYSFVSTEVAIFFSFPNDVTLKEYADDINSTYTLPTPRSTADAKFAGWYLDAAYTTAAASPFTMSKNTTLYAKYTPMTSGGHFNYEVVGDHVEIIRVMAEEELAEVPSTLENKPVTVIRTGAISEESLLSSLIIDQGITTIEDGAISDNLNLAIVSIPASVTSIGKNNFVSTQVIGGSPKMTYFYVNANNATYETDGHVIIERNSLTVIASATYGMTEYYLPEKVLAIGDYAFRGTALTTIQVPGTLLTIGEGAFYMSALTNFHYSSLPKLEKVGKLAFYSTNIKSFILSAFTTEVGPGAFAGETPLNSMGFSGMNTTFTWADDCLYKTATGELVAIAQGTDILPAVIKSIAPYTFYGTLGARLTVQGAITSIGEYAFANTNFTSQNLVFSDTSALTTIGDYAFAKDSALSTFNIPAQVTSIGKGVFFGCRALATITVDPTNTAFSSISNIFLVKNATPINQVNLIVAYAPKNMNGNFVLPPLPFLALGDDLFGHGSASGITSVSVAPLTQLSANVFSDVYGLTTIDLSTATFTTVVSNAFAEGHSLTTLTLPSTITSIETNAFSYSLILTHLNFAGTKAQWAQIHFATGWNAHVGFNTVTCSDGDVAITPYNP